ncbi:major facilitator superfamily [Heterobasidion irregulare TC 32-1]|uniref:Major facilitator superfamily n=1 Tax=Heterobasidion irregulare (strain TC 32-1) TaxID=747525 RepID=W4JUU0_HETIT|nr:major facilitator superfamily [Heterobasidion irregulare TC 32-1]ETW76666.1 major facilitator superfamily [Heterobasidion irregulare TC 32-1]
MPLDSEKNLLPMARATPETPEAEDKERGFSPTPNSLKTVGVERTICVQEVDVSDDAYVMDPIAEKKLVRKIDIRIIPAMMAIHTLNFLARANIGNAKVLNANNGHSLDETIHVTDKQYLDALMIFFVAYSIFETPSNYMLKRFFPSRWFAFLMLGWGAMVMILGGVQNFGGLVAVRFLLGAFEAGLFPGIIYFLTFWYPPHERASRTALIVTGASMGGAFGGSIAFGIGNLDGVKGIEAWRWLFILEGIPSVACAILVFFFFPDYPESAKWLSEEERKLSLHRLKGNSSSGHARISWAETEATLTDGRLYLHYLAYVSQCVPFSSISLFAPTIVAGLGYQGLDAQLFTVPPFAIAFVVTVSVSRMADKYQSWSLGSVIALTMAGVSFLVQVVTGALPPTAFKARYAMLCLASSFTYSVNPCLLSWLTANLRNTSATTLAVALNFTLGNIGQIIGK